MSAHLELRALRADTAHGYLAALGMMQALRRASVSPRLAWSDEFTPHAVLHGVDSFEHLVDAVLRDRDKRMSGVVLGYPQSNPFPTLARSPEEFTQWLDAVYEADIEEDPDVDLWCGLLIQGGLTGKGWSRSTIFDFTSGQKQFLKIARSVGAGLDEGKLSEALIGPWKWESTESTLGFESSGQRLGALRAIPPGDDTTRGVPGADWLAFLGLAYYPLSLVPARDRPRVVTPACDPTWDRSAFRWPVWRNPLTHREIAAVVTHPGLVGSRVEERITSPEELAAMGVQSVWQCPIVHFGQGYGAFGPPARIEKAVERRTSTSG